MSLFEVTEDVPGERWVAERTEVDHATAGVTASPLGYIIMGCLGLFLLPFFVTPPIAMVFVVVKAGPVGLLFVPFLLAFLAVPTGLVYAVTRNTGYWSRLAWDGGEQALTATFAGCSFPAAVELAKGLDRPWRWERFRFR